MMDLVRKSSTSNTNGYNGEKILNPGQRKRPTKRSSTCKSLKSSASLSELLSNLILNDGNKENDHYAYDDFRNKPDLWMAAFDNPIDFIEYCRKRLDHERKLVEKSRVVENQIVQLLEKLTDNSARYGTILDDLFKVQSINDKLQEIIMEERTHCQHLIGVNEQLETERKIMARKFHAALLLGKVDEKSVEHLLEKDPKVVPLADQVSKLSSKIKKCDAKSKKKPACTDPVVLADKVTRLETHINGLKKQHREEVAVLKDAIEKYDLKCEAITTQFQDLLRRDGLALQDVKESLSNVMCENVHLREELLKKDDKFLQVQMDEIQAATRKRPGRRTNNVDEISQAFQECTAIEKDLKVRLARTEIELVEKSNILRDSMSKIIMLERKCANLENQANFMQKTHETCVSNLKSRNEVLEKRIQKSEDRRRFDNAGFREDVRELRRLLKTLNKSVQKSIRVYGGPSRLEAIGSAVPNDRELEKILLSKKSEKSLDKWLQKVDPKKSQQAMSIWADFLGRKLNQLEKDLKQARKPVKEPPISRDEMVTLYDNKSNMRGSTESIPSRDDTWPGDDSSVWSQDDESSDTDYNDPPSNYRSTSGSTAK